MATVIVSGAIANKCGNGGATWTRLSWVLGLRKLGFDAYFFEEIESETCVDFHGHPASLDGSVNQEYFRTVMREFGLSACSALVTRDGREVCGMSRRDILAVAEDADLLVNISGNLKWSEVRGRVRRTAYVDLDPGFTQFWHCSPASGGRVAAHDFYFTIGENIGAPGCPIPTGGIRWRPVRQPVVLQHWPVAPLGDPDCFTTVASWRGPYGPVTYGGVTYGLKVHQFRHFATLPRLAPQRFQIALDIDPADWKDRSMLQDHGWELLDPRSVAGNPSAFRAYIQGSGAEFSVAQGIYTETNSGWFSDRTVRYLASGKPALVQDTGFSSIYPTGEGLLAFRNREEAITGAQELRRQYRVHAEAARALAETYFDSTRVLGRFVDEIGIGS